MLHKKLNSVKVLFVNPKYNYETSVSADTTLSSAKSYFVGKHFNLGKGNIDNLQKCIGIEFTDENKGLKAPATKGLRTLCAKSFSVTGLRKKDGTQKKGFVTKKRGKLVKKTAKKPVATKK